MSNLSSNEVFQFSRFFHLCRVEFLRSYKSLLIKAAAVIGFFLLGSLLNGFQREPQYYFPAYAGIFAVLGLLITAGSFRSYYRRDRNAFFLTLPASWLEKWLVKFLGSTAGWMIFSFAAYTVYTFVAAGLNELIFGFHTSPFWWQKEIGWLYLHFLIAQSVFFLGSSVFRKTPLFKTGLSLFALTIFLSLVFMLFAKIVIPNEWAATAGIEHWNGPGITFHLGEMPESLKAWGRGLVLAGKIFYWGLLAPFSLLVSMVRFREIEVKDGV